MKTFSFILKAIPVFFIAIAISGCKTSQDSSEKPDDNRFTKVVLAQRLEEPMQFQVLKDGRVIIAERKGKLKVYDPASGDVKVIANFPVSTKYVSKDGVVTEGEDGLQGVILDPDYDENHWIYVYYAPAGDPPKNTLERYEWLGDDVILSSKKVVLDVPTQREECCHVGGGMLFDKDKNLYLSTGDNTFSRASDGFSPLDERPGMSAEDSQKGSSNTNDLRGKILRIHPKADGTYTIPEGNMFPVGTPKTRPEIYTMGNRNPWRLTIDSKTGWLYWGEVGPDGSKDDLEKRGPQSYDEFNRAKEPGNFGWPYFVADNKAYNEYDFETKESGDFYDPVKPINNSPNNTGMLELPPATPAWIWYGKGESEEFPLLGSGGNSAVGGPIYHRSDFKKDAKRPFPAYYEGKWFITDFARGWVNLVEMDEQGEYKSMERFLPDLKLLGPLDMKFGPEGDLYVIEYGQGYFLDNPEAQLIKIEYNGGNRKPQVQTSASKVAGAVPLKVNLSSTGTQDFDAGDVLTYEWKITKDGEVFNTLKDANPDVTFDEPGIYTATLIVTDQEGASNSSSVEIKVGNEPPVVKLNVTSGNSSFFLPGKAVHYEVSITDKEDGSLSDKKILPAQVSVSGNYFSEGFNPTVIAQNQQSVDASAQYAGAISLINGSDCKACHATNETLLGPAFVQVAQKYKDDPAAETHLAAVITKGGAGVWGHASMPAHPNMAPSDVKSIIKYILSLAYPPRVAEALPVKGIYTTVVPGGEDGTGSFIIRAAYTDRGTSTAPAQFSEDILVLHSPTLLLSKADQIKEVVFNQDSTLITVKEGSQLRFEKIDLTAVDRIELVPPNFRARPGVTVPATKGIIEIYSGSADGKLIGKYEGAYTGKTSLKIPLTSKLGMTDLYFVFKGDTLRITGIRLY